MNLHVVDKNSDLQKDPNRILLDMLKSRWNQNDADNDQELKVMDGNNSVVNSNVSRDSNEHRFRIVWSSNRIEAYIDV